MSYLLSLLGTVFNNADVVEDSLGSLINGLENSTFDYEIVLVDNYSTDSTFERITELAKNNPRVKIYQERCTRGKGRQIALKKSTGLYVMPVDLDSIYSPDFFKLVAYLVHNGSKKNEIVDGFTTRETMLKIGGWRDLNSSEDAELCSRAISQGFKWFRVPLMLVENQPSKLREKRYSKNALNYIIRLINNRMDKIRSLGIRSFTQLNARSFLEKIFDYFSLVLCKIKGLEIYSYVDTPYNNWDFIGMNSHFLDPYYIGINKDLWGYTTYRYLFKPKVLESQISELYGLGLGKIYEFNSGLILITTDLADMAKVSKINELIA